MRRTIPALFLILEACTPAVAPQQNTAPCVPVAVMDEAGRPVQNATVHTEATAWIEPAGAFRIEGAHPLTMRGDSTLTGADGRACIEDARGRLDTERARLKAEARGSGSLPYGGIFGAQMAHSQTARVYAEYTGLAPARLALPPWRGTGAEGPATLLMGPPRERMLLVHSDCDPASLLATLSLALRDVTGVAEASGTDGVRFHFSGLGPEKVEVRVRSCEGTATAVLDGRAKDDVVELRTRESKADPRGGPRGTPTQLALREGRGCLVTDAHDVGCFERLYLRTDLVPPRFLGAWSPAGALPSVAKVSVGHDFSCVLTDGGDVMCWGSSTHGALGAPVGTVSVDAPLKIALPARATDVELGAEHACVLTEGGATYCWGWNAYGQLGIGERGTDATTPVLVPKLQGAKALALGDTHTCAITAQGEVACAGWNTNGEVGPGPRSSDSVVSTATVVPFVRDAVRIATGNGVTSAWDTHGERTDWGRTGASTTTTPIIVPDRAVPGERQKAETDTRTCIIHASGELTCADKNRWGAAGAHTTPFLTLWLKP